MISTRFARRRVITWAVAVALTVSTGAAGCSSATSPQPVSAAATGLETIEPGVLTVAVQPYAPYTSLVGDKLTGLDSEILDAVAGKLRLRVRAQNTDFAGMLAGVQSRRVDITIGGVAWTAERQKQGLFTDPPYYSPPAMAVRDGQRFSTLADLERHRLGTVEGYVWVKAIQAVPGATLRAFPDATGVFDDLGAGRLDVGFLDPLVVIAAQQQRPELKIQTQYLTAPTAQQVAQHPEYAYFQPYMTSFYLPEQAPKLEAAISAEIRKMYGDGTLTGLIKKYGGDTEQFLKPSPEMAATRRGVDRPADWTPPSI